MRRARYCSGARGLRPASGLPTSIRRRAASRNSRGNTSLNWRTPGEHSPNSIRELQSRHLLDRLGSDRGGLLLLPFSTLNALRFSRPPPLFFPPPLPLLPPSCTTPRPLFFFFFFLLFCA